MSTEPITPDEALTATRALHAAAAAAGRLITSGSAYTGDHRAPTFAGRCRAAADFLEVTHEPNSAGILRRAADQIDPPKPTEPFTTADQWITTARFQERWTNIHTPESPDQMAALRDAVKRQLRMTIDTPNQMLAMVYAHAMLNIEFEYDA